MGTSAAPPRYTVDRLWPDPAVDLDLDAAYADLAVGPPPADRPWVAMNVVTSVDGRAQRGGTAEGLGTRADRRLMRLLRVGFDAVAYGAGSLRKADLWTDVPEGLAAIRYARGRSRQPLAVLIGGEGPIPTDRRWFGTDQPRLAIVGRGGPRQLPHTEVLVAPTPRPEPGWVLDALHKRGIRSVLLEGGPTVNATFHAAGLVDELFWTVGPWLMGGDGLPMLAPEPPAEFARPASLVSVHRHEGELFLRYRIGPASDG